MVLRALPGSAGYMFASWPASPPVFDGVARPASGRLYIPAASPAGAGADESLLAVEPGMRVDAGAPLVRAIEGAPAALAPCPGSVIGSSSATLTNARACATVVFVPSDDADPIWTAFDDAAALDPIRRVEPQQLVEWVDRFRAAGLGADRHTSPDLLTQLYESARRPVDTVLCNLLDADPSACLNAALAATYPIELAAGVMLVWRIARAGRAIAAVDARVPAGWTAALRRAGRGALRIESMVNDYPQADPTLMLYTFLGRRLRPGRLPTEQGVIQLDAAAAVAIGRCALAGAPILSMPLVVRDHALGQSFFLFVPIGMRIDDVLAHAQPSPACSIVRGGDLLRDVRLGDSAVTGAVGELVLHASDPQPSVVPDPCIRCGWCAEACPTRLHPAGVLEAAQLEDLEMARRFGIDACIECGICSYVCPSRLPLLQGIRRLRQVER